jgi:hypothetical protein
MSVLGLISNGDYLTRRWLTKSLCFKGSKEVVRGRSGELK